PAGRCRADGARDRASPRRRETGGLDHRPGAGCGRGRRTRRGPGHSRERRPRRRVRDRPIPAGPHVMAGSVLRVLIVEDSASDAELMVRALRQGGFEIVQERVQTADAMRAAMARHPWVVVLSDYSLPHFDAPAALAVVRATAPDVPFIVVSGSVGEDTAVAVMQAGAADYIMKDRLQRLDPAVTRAVEGAAVRRERRQLEELLQQSQRMEAVGRLAGGIAHDFNNVLTAVLGSIELLLLDAPPDRPHREELDIIRDAATRARDLIRQLLAFSARQVLQPMVVDLNRLVKDIAKLLRRLIGEDIALETTLAPALGAVRVDTGQIEQVLVNLAVNARDAMPQGGRLAIETDNVEVDGTRAPPAATVPAPAAGTETILLAEDERLVRVLAQKVLERAGYRVLVATGGTEALAVAEHHDGPIHLLLTDVVMPEMNGRELARRLAALRPG